MVASREEVRALQARVEYVERHERERERDLHKQLDKTRHELEQLRCTIGTQELKYQKEMAHMQEKWGSLVREGKAAQERAECIWRNLMVEERARLVEQQKARDSELTDAFYRMAEKLTAEAVRLSNIVASNAEKQQQHQKWLEQHRKERSDFSKMVDETCGQLRVAIRREQQAREESTMLIEKLLTSRNGADASARVHRF